MKGEHHHRVFECFRPGFDIAAARRERAARGDSDMFGPHDLYVDVAPCLRALRALGLRIGIAGNQPAGGIDALRSLDLAADHLASSASLGAAKPSPAFFAGLIAMAKMPARDIAYVGDRLDNDILPARNAGLATVFVTRGPWAKVHAKRPEAALADVTLTSLAGLPEAVGRLATR